MFNNALFQMRLESLLDDNSSGGEMFPQPIIIEPQSPQEQVSSNQIRMWYFHLFIMASFKSLSKTKIQATNWL